MLPVSANFLLRHAAPGLGAGGVLIVAASVGGALGLCSMFGMWSTLIVMEVIPFLVLAVGVDNMFVLAHAFGRQVRRYVFPLMLCQTVLYFSSTSIFSTRTFTIRTFSAF